MGWPAPRGSAVDDDLLKRLSSAQPCSPPLSDAIGFAKEMNTMRVMPLTQAAMMESVVTAIHHQDIVETYTATKAPERVAVFHVLYPHTDARTHRSLDALVNTLHLRGLHHVAEMVRQEAHYLVFKDPANAWKALHEIRNDSLAIGVHLYYKGQSGEAAEVSLDADAHRAR
jgi:hypothetical protein